MVLDASALPALVNAEPGAEIVASALGEAVISAVNLAEVVTKLIDLGVPRAQAWSETASVVPVVVDFGLELANATARLRTPTRQAGLSLGDCACLALAESLRQPALTTDRAWRNLSIGVEIHLIR
jgi:ribonuclease VapC